MFLILNTHTNAAAGFADFCVSPLPFVCECVCVCTIWRSSVCVCVCVCVCVYHLEEADAALLLRAEFN